AAARVVEGEGWIALPAFVDACSATGLAVPEPEAEQDVPVPYDAGPRIDMRAANRKGVQPAFRAVDALALEDDATTAWRDSGFGTLVCAPHGELLVGDGALVVTRDAAARDRVLTPDVGAHAAFRASGGGYPSTIMAHLAQLRQFFHDARRQAVLEERFAAGRPGARPPFDANLRAALPLLDGSKRLWCRAERADDIRRWLRLADEFELSIGIVGGREAWRVAETLAERGVPVVLTLEWGKEVEDPHAEKKKTEEKKEKAEESRAEDAEEAEGAEEAGEEDSDEEVAKDPNVYVEPMALREERRRLWLEGRDCALRLAEAGVEFGFGTVDAKPGELLKNVRTLVEAGLAEEVALAALTSTPAEQLGVGARIGALEVGRDATLALWTGSPFRKESKLARLFVDGFEHEFDLEVEDEDATPPDEGVDASGEWTLSFRGSGDTRDGSASLTMAEDGAVTGTLRSEAPDGSMLASEVEGRVSGTTLVLRGTFEVGGTSIEVRLEAELDGDSLSGESVGKAEFGEFEQQVTGTRTPQEVRQ
ncbi:MAG TPA: amidohydrolase family protein, partial [Planctomycetota bacterium]|nr:amidohydrolase family protein [Planctomycetota bacterium]